MKGIQVASPVQSVSPSISMHVAFASTASRSSALATLSAALNTSTEPTAFGRCPAATARASRRSLRGLSEAADTSTTKAGLSWTQ